MVSMEEVGACTASGTMDPAVPVVTIRNLNFAYNKGSPNLVALNCVIPPRARVILAGANGAGKSTLLRVLTGQIFIGLEYDELDISGTQKPNDQFNGLAYLGGTWMRRRGGFEAVCPYTMDIAAGDMMKDWQEEYRERRDELVRVLGINLKWRMNECSDGQRKKVRIMIKLLRPFQLCVIDEFAADLDIFSRSRFLDYLTCECEKRNAAVVYATHIFDQADVWASHAMFMRLDKTLSPLHDLKTFPPYVEILERTGARRAMCPMYVLVLEELQRQYREQGVFMDDEQSLIEFIMEAQGKEQGATVHETKRSLDQSSWVSGRLNAAKDEVKRAKKREQTRQALEHSRQQALS